jgi:cobalt-zinc-cadmium efflux system protein
MSAHSHDHDHPHSAADVRELGRQRLLLVLALTAAFMSAEFAGGWIANSLALMADAGHMLSDVAALALSALALRFARRPATPEKTYGYLRTEILAALANGVALVVIAILIFSQAWHRLRVPEPVAGGLMLAVATAGLLVNLMAAILLHGTAAHSLNVRAAYLHVLGDLVGSVGAMIAAGIILLTGWVTADPIISIVVAGLILASSWRLVRDSVDVLLEATPRHIDLAAVRRTICEVPGVEEIHDLHVWTLTSGVVAMSAHLVVADPLRHPALSPEVHRRMHERFGIRHVTIQVDPRPVYPLRSRADAPTTPRPDSH